MTIGKEYKGNQVVIEGSKTGEEVFVTKCAYNSLQNLEFIAEAKFGTKDSMPKWYLEKFDYDSCCNLTQILTATNQLYSNINEIIIDKDINNPNITIIFNDLHEDILSNLNEKDAINLTTLLNDNKIQGMILSIDRINSKIIVEVGNNTIVNETVLINDKDLIFTLNHPSTKPFNKRMWSLRKNYIYA